MKVEMDGNWKCNKQWNALDVVKQFDPLTSHLETSKHKCALTDTNTYACAHNCSCHFYWTHTCEWYTHDVALVYTLAHIQTHGQLHARIYTRTQTLVHFIHIANQPFQLHFKQLTAFGNKSRAVRINGIQLPQIASCNGAYVIVISSFQVESKQFFKFHFFSYWLKKSYCSYECELRRVRAWLCQCESVWRLRKPDKNKPKTIFLDK